MLAKDYLSLMSVCIDSSEEWTCNPEGLSFLFPKGGAGKCIAGPVTQRLAPGDVLALDGRGQGKRIVAAEGKMAFWCFSLVLEHLYPLFAAKEICLLQNVAESFKALKLYPAASPVARECHRLLGVAPPQFNLDHRSHLLRVVAAILSEEFKKVQKQRVGFIRPEVHLFQVFERLPADELLSLSVGELADKFGCSRRHLNRLFHQHFGSSVAALRMEMRLLKAVFLLRNPDAKVINVAEQCGFNHLGLFNTCFKRRFGSTPGRWGKLASQSKDQRFFPKELGSGCPLHTSGVCPWSGKAEVPAPTSAEASRLQEQGSARPLLSTAAAHRTAVRQAVTATH